MKKQTVLYLLLIPFYTLAQTPLTTGDRLPDWNFSPLLNAPSNTRLSYLEGKAVIVCFWSSTCGSSLTLMARAHKWEEQFGQQLKVIFVVDDKDPTAPAKALAARPTLKALKVPLMKRDTALLRLFPHTGGPHIILIGSDRKIKAITTMNQVTEEVVKALVQEKELNLPVRKPTLGREEQTSLVMDGLVESQNLMFNTVITGVNEALPAGLSWSKLDKGRHRLLLSNLTLPQLYLTAYESEISGLPFQKQKQVLFEAEQANPAERYCYEHLMPSALRNKSMARLRIDLDQYFNLKSEVEKRQTECWLLEPIAGKARNADTGPSYSQIWPDSIEMKNVTLVAIASALNRTFAGKFFRVEGDSSSRYSVNLKTVYQTEEEVGEDLAKRGFRLVPVRREIDFLVIQDAEPGRNKKAAR